MSAALRRASSDPSDRTVQGAVPTTLDEALAAAQAVDQGDVGAPVGHLIDSLALFLGSQPRAVLVEQQVRLTQILDQLGANRAIMLANWLARNADDLQSCEFWEQVEAEQRMTRLLALRDYL